MERVLYVVAREQPLMVGYLMARVGARTPAGHPVEIKVDERRSERRLSSEARDPDRRSRDRRRRPSLDRELRDHGFAAVQTEVSASAPVEPMPAWRPRASWGRRAARAGRRRRTVFWASILALLVVVGVSLVVASIRRTPAPAESPAPQIAPPIARPTPPVAPPVARPAPTAALPTSPVAKAPSPAPVPKPETVVPAAPPPPPSRPAPVRIVSTRSSGVVQAVDPRARSLVLEERGVAGTGRLRVELAPDARVVLSQREARAADPTHPFTDTPIDLSDVRRGDYVVVDIQGPEGRELGRSVTVTFRSP